MSVAEYVSIGGLAISLVTVAISIWQARRDFVRQSELTRMNDERQRERSLEQERRQRVVEHLIESYSAIEDAAGREVRTPEQTARLEKAMARIQLFGNTEEVRAAREFAAEAANGGADPTPLLQSLRSTLRNELGLEPAQHDPLFLRYDVNERPRAAHEVRRNR